MKSPVTSTVLSAHGMMYAPYPPAPVVYEWCKQVLVNAPYYSPLPRIRQSEAGFWWVTDGARTRTSEPRSDDIRCHVLLQVAESAYLIPFQFNSGIMRLCRT